MPLEFGDVFLFRLLEGGQSGKCHLAILLMGRGSSIRERQVGRGGAFVSQMRVGGGTYERQKERDGNVLLSFECGKSTIQIKCICYYYYYL